MDLGGVNVGCDEACADSARQYEGQSTALDLLVLGDELHQAVRARQAARNRGDMDRQADSRKVALDALGLRRG